MEMLATVLRSMVKGAKCDGFGAFSLKVAEDGCGSILHPAGEGMTVKKAKAIVLERYPDAKCRKVRGTAFYQVGCGVFGSRRLSGNCDTQGQAWKDAAEIVQAKVKE